MATTTTTNVNALVAKIAGAVLVIIGLWGFVDKPILGVFGVNTLHNLVHLATGIVLLVVGFLNEGEYSRVTNQVLGVVYIIVAILGFANIVLPDLLAMSQGGANPAYDNALHLVLGVVFAGVGWGVQESATKPAGTA